MKKYENDNGFKAFTAIRGSMEIPSIWVCKSEFVGMTQDKFVGRFKLHNTQRSKKSSTSEVLGRFSDSLPCKLLIHMASNRVGERVKALVNLVDCGMIDDRHVGIVISGIA